MFAGIFAGCKKGDDDPAISLRSRKARLTGVWTLTDANYTVAGKNTTTTYQFDAKTGIMTQTFSGGSFSYSNNYTYSRTLTINKDYTYKDVEVQNGNYTVTTEGYWFFAPKNKDIDVRNKERVVFQKTKVTVDNKGNVSYNTYAGTSNSQTDIIDLKELRNKKITINLDYTHSDDDGLVSTITGTETFEQK
jgi:hypothetical protein